MDSPTYALRIAVTILAGFGIFASLGSYFTYAIMTPVRVNEKREEY